MSDHTNWNQPKTAEPQLQTALCKAEEFSGLRAVSRINPAVLLLSASWAGILYLILR